jgi:sugar transferase (PEP-CTERM/EpsH1 system associated)
MKILFISPYPPSLVRVRPYNFVRFLTERGNQVTVATLYANASEKEDAEKLKASCQSVFTAPIKKWQSLWNCSLALPTQTPLQAVYSWRSDFAKQILNLIEKENPSFDVIHIEHLRGSKYGTYLRSVLHAQKRPIPVVWDSVDCISLLFRMASTRSKSLFGRITSRLELGRTEKYEAQILGEFDHTCVTSRIDQTALIKLAQTRQITAPISVIPNGVDLKYFAPTPQVSRHKSTLVVSGKMSYHANVSMVLYLAKEILPLVWQQHPETQLQVVGKDPTREIMALSENPAISVVGGVTDMRPYLQQATLAATPILYGVGIQNKVLEAMACATPVVSTSQAISALEVQNSRELLVADHPKQFANAICQLLENETQRHEMGMAGRAYVEKHHDWFQIAGKLEQIYHQAGQK